jgi:DNA-binding NarL/FixJ family response regulator
VADLRVVAVTVGPLLRDIITTLLSDHVAVKIIAVLDTRAECEKAIEDIDPDLILIGLQPGEPDEIAPILLRRLPSARVVAVSDEGRRVYVHRMRRHRKILQDASPQEVVEAILGTG